MIKLLVSDMDGTLFNSDQEISPLNLAAIKEANEKGVRFMIATGRSIDTIKPTIEKYNLNCGLILMNGAEIRDEDEKIVSTINIDYDIANRLSKRLDELGYIPEYMTSHGAQICDTEERMQLNMGYRILCLDREHKLSLEEAIEVGKTSMFMKTLHRNDSLDDLYKKKVEIRKIIVFNPDGSLNDKNREILKNEFPELSILSSYPENIEINLKAAQKGPGLLNAIEKMGIEKEEVAVFGDGLNDLSLIELFPNSYVPVNGHPELKKIAKEVIPSNNDDGVGKKIFEILYHNRVEQIGL